MINNDTIEIYEQQMGGGSEKNEPNTSSTESSYNSCPKRENQHWKWKTSKKITQQTSLKERYLWMRKKITQTPIEENQMYQSPKETHSTKKIHIFQSHTSITKFHTCQKRIHTSISEHPPIF